MTRKEHDKYLYLYADRLYRFLRKSNAIRGKERDIVHDLFLKMMKDLENVEDRNVEAYLFKSATRMSLNEIRRSKRMKKIPEDYVEPAFDQDMTAFNKREIIDDALDLLSVEQRTAIILRDVEEYDYDEIAEIMETSYNAVKKYICKGRIIMKRYLVDLDNLI
jgi:RNA polymerase sigma factor (sigma-70 family)